MLPRDAADVRRVIQENMFALIVGTSDAGLIATHLPLLFDADRGAHGTLVGHVARANPHAAVLASGREMMAVFCDAHGYISPSWYPYRARPPTWNYAAVHCYGIPVMSAPEDSLRHVERLVATMERGRPQAWSVADLPAPERERLLSNIIAFEIPLTRIDAKFKMSQGERPANLAASVAALEQAGNHALAQWMRTYNAVALAEAGGGSAVG
jgi:transcriptional regulator